MADMKERANTGVNAGADAARKGVDAAEKGAHGLVDKAGDMVEKGKQAAGQLMDQAGEMGHKVQRWAGDAYEATADKVKEGVDSTTDLIRKYPIPAVLIGLGVGLLIGKLMR